MRSVGRARRRLTLALLVAACARHERLVVTDLRVVDSTPPTESLPRPSAGELRDLVADALDGPYVKWRGGASGGYRCLTELALEEATVEGRGIVRASLSIRLEPRERDADVALETAAVVERSYKVAEHPDKAALVREHVKRALSDAMATIHTQARLRFAPPRDLVAALSDRDAEVRAAACRMAAARREPSAVPRLIEMLRDGNADLADAALGALVAIGDRRAVRPLLDLASFRDTEGMIKVIDAVASLGGDEARAYLELVATGHEDPELRKQAHDALQRMTGTRVEPPAEPPSPAPKASPPGPSHFHPTRGPG